MKNVFIIILTTLGCLAAANRATAQTVASGTTDACTWTITGTAPNYTLTISGAGAMADYTDISTPPWYSYRSNTKTLDIQSGVTHIGNYAFHNCTGFTGTLTIPDGVISIGTNSFLSCTGFTALTLPNSLNTIGVAAFNACRGLTGTLTIPNPVETIGYNAFLNCTALTSVIIPASVKTIGSTVFLNCTALTAITVDPGNQNYSSDNGVLFNKTKQSLICYPAGKTGDI